MTRLRKLVLRVLALALPLLGCAAVANALPSYARQTEQACAACHVGGDWPQLRA